MSRPNSSRPNSPTYIPTTYSNHISSTLLPLELVKGAKIPSYHLFLLPHLVSSISFLSFLPVVTVLPIPIPMIHPWKASSPLTLTEIYPLGVTPPVAMASGIWLTLNISFQLSRIHPSESRPCHQRLRPLKKHRMCSPLVRDLA